MTIFATVVLTTSEMDALLFMSLIFLIRPASTWIFSGETRETTAVMASSSLSMSQSREESGFPLVESLHQQRSVEVTITSLAGGLGDQAARMAGGRV